MSVAMSLPWRRPRRWGTSEVMLLFLVACLVNDDLYARMRDKLAAEADTAAQDSAVPGDTGEGSDTAAPVDGDGDGYDAAEDCDDGDGTVNPGAAEVCNGQDDDCDGDVDVGASDAVDAWRDADGDAWGIGTPEARCLPAEGWVNRGGDCDDGNGNVHPEATERWDGVRNDCEGGAPDQLDTTNADASWTGADASSDLGRLLAPGPDLDGDGAMGLLIGSMDGGIGRIDVVDGIVRRPDLSMVPRVMGWNGVDAPVWGEFGPDYSALLFVSRAGGTTEYSLASGVPIVVSTSASGTVALGRWAGTDDFGVLVALAGGSVGMVADVLGSEWSVSTQLLRVTGVPVVAASEDVDDDGYSDIVIGVPDEGRVVVVSGLEQDGTSPLSELIGTPGGRLGTVVDFLGDVYGDGVEYIGIAEPGLDDPTTDIGAYHLFPTTSRGSSYVDEVVNRFTGRGPRNEFGASSAHCSLRDGAPTSFIFGNQRAISSHAERGGQVYVAETALLGVQDASRFDVVLEGGSIGYALGRSIATADIDGDARCDFVVSAMAEGYGDVFAYLGFHQ